jgi:ParB/RepB/Spo0J family partition protein
MLFDRQPLEILKGSIGKVGVLVPLTVYKEAKSSRFVILDGQRRWICAQELGLEFVPVNEVAEPSLVQNIVTMFQIHELREDWELMPTALKLELLMKELKETNDKKIAELTRLDPAVVSRCKKLLTFPKKYQDMMLDADPAKRVKADFFIELAAVRNDRFVNALSWFDKNTFTDRMLARYQSRGGGIKAVTDFRLIKQALNLAQKAKRHGQISKRFRDFVEDDSHPIDYLRLPEVSVAASARKLTRAAENLEGELRLVDADDFLGEEQLWRSLERLLKTLRSKLRAAGRRLSE